MNFFEILKVLVLGIVEGFTEWLPISSTGHMILVDEIIHLNVSEAFREVFMVVIQLGAILAVVVLYFHKLNPFSPRKTQNQKRATIRLWMKIVVACIPAAVIGLPFDNLLDKLMNGYVVSAMLILYGVFFILLENRNRGVKFRIQRVTQISFQTAAAIDCSRCLPWFREPPVQGRPSWELCCLAAPGERLRSFPSSWEFPLCLGPVS